MSAVGDMMGGAQAPPPTPQAPEPRSQSREPQRRRSGRNERRGGIVQGGTVLTQSTGLSSADDSPRTVLGV